MVAVSPPRLRSSVIEQIITWRAERRTKRADTRARPHPLALFLLAVVDSAATLIACAALVVGGFTAVAWLGWMLLCPAVLVADFDLGANVRRRAGR